MKVFLLFTFLLFSFIEGSLANLACPVCTVAIGASLSLAHKLGLQDSIVGLWSGALLTLLGYWTIAFFSKKNWNFKGRDPLLIFLSVSIIGFIYIKEVIYTPKVILYIFYLDTILFSSIVGSIIFIFSSKLYKIMKLKNGGHAHFPFEKVVFPILFLVITSIIFNFIKF